MDQFPPLLTPPMEQALLPLDSDTGVKPVFYHYPPPSFSSSEQPSSNNQESSPSNQSEDHPLSACISQPTTVKKSEFPMIHPCTDYQTHAAWLSKYFPAEMNKKGRYLVQVILQIKTYRSMTKYLGYTPEEWRFTLGDYKYEQYYDCIPNLIIIWSLTMDRTDPIPYSEYHECKMSLYDTILETFESILPHKHQEPYLDDLKAPPVYSRFSPYVEKTQEKSKFSSSKSTSMSCKSRKHHIKDHRSESKTKHSHKKPSKPSNISYHTTMPSQVDSKGNHVAAAPKPKSNDSSSSSSSDSSWSTSSRSTKFTRRS